MHTLAPRLGRAGAGELWRGQVGGGVTRSDRKTYTNLPRTAMDSRRGAGFSSTGGAIPKALDEAPRRGEGWCLGTLWVRRGASIVLLSDRRVGPNGERSMVLDIGPDGLGSRWRRGGKPGRLRRDGRERGISRRGEIEQIFPLPDCVGGK